MKVKTSELIDAALDWATGVAGGTPGLHIVNRPDKVCVYSTLQMPSGDLLKWPVQPSTDWSQGGPIIDRAKISVIHMEGTEHWMARKFQPDCDTPPKSEGPTSLIAAMRCYVTSKLGDTVDIPKELLKSASQVKKETP